MTRVFISYSHKDEALRAELDKHLSLMRRQGEIDIWSDHRIPPGGDLDNSISEALESAEIVMLLLSADFIDSDYCFGVEMKRAMELHERGKAIVLPVMLRPCDFQSAPFGRLKAVPTDGKAVTKWPNQDEAFVDIVKHVRKLLGQRARSQPEVVSDAPSTDQHSSPSQAVGVRRSSNLSLPREFSDQDKHDFSSATFKYVLEYFEGSLQALKERNQKIETRMNVLSDRAFSVIVFRAGKRVAGCHIRVGGMFRADDGIAYSNNENSGENSFNELLSVEADAQSLYLRATMGMFHQGSDSKLSQEGAAEHLWSMLISPLQSR